MKLQIKSTVIFTIGLILICNFLFGQSLQLIKNQLDSNRIDLALEGINTFSISPENAAEYYVVAANVYFHIAKSNEFNSLVAEPIKLSFESISKSYNYNNQSIIKDDFKFIAGVLEELQLMSFQIGMKQLAIGQQNRVKEKYRNAAISLKLAKSIMDFKHHNLKTGWNYQDQVLQIYYTKSLILTENEQEALVNAKIIFNNIEKFKDNISLLEGVAQWLDQYYRLHQYNELYIGFNDVAGELFRDSYFLMSRMEYYQSRRDTIAQIQSFQNWKSQLKLSNKFFYTKEYQSVMLLYYNYIFNNITHTFVNNQTINPQNLLELLRENYERTRNFEIGLLLVKSYYNLLVLDIRAGKHKTKVGLRKRAPKIFALCDELKLLYSSLGTGNVEIQIIEQNLKRIVAAN